MKVKIGVSNRHVHLTHDDYVLLFGNETIKKERDLVQKGQFASSSKVTIKTDKNYIENVRVLGPFRNYTQVEISKTDSYFLGINPPIRNSGDLTDANEITIIGPMGSIVRKSCIIATRHIHINKSDRDKLGLTNIDYVKVEVGNIKKSILYDVYIKESEDGVFELHLDLDDANACFLKNGDKATILDF